MDVRYTYNEIHQLMQSLQSDIPEITPEVFITYKNSDLKTCLKDKAMTKPVLKKKLKFNLWSGYKTPEHHKFQPEGMVRTKMYCDM